MCDMTKLCMYFCTSHTERCVPQDISVTQNVNGSYKVTWKFNGEDSDLSGFLVDVEGDEVKEVCASSRTAEIRGLKPAPTNIITVVALYKDGKQTECQLDAIA